MPSVNTNMGPLSTKLSPSKGAATKSSGVDEGVYYAVYIPPDLLGDYDYEFSECEPVFDNKEEALLFIKRNKKIRFKSFRNFQDAQNFAYNGCAGVNSSLLDSSGAAASDLMSSPKAVTPAVPLAVEKSSPFKSLKSQELVKLRKLIEKGNLGDVKKLVWENPRYLVSSGDFPTILQEGCRYNALHVSTKAMNPAMTELLLETIGNPAFTNLLYDTNSQENASYIERSEILLDLYLNTPDKGLNETPLHFASKFGSVECVKRLIACAKIQLQAKNKDGKTPLEITCSRCPNASEEVKSTIKRLLSQDQYYVPIWCSSDACDVPLVGPPCRTSETPTKMSKRRDEHDITSPTLEIKAFAGPMNESSAKAFRSKWRREVKNVDLLAGSPLSTPGKMNNSSLNNSNFLQSPHTSLEKSFEIVGRRLALENQYEWRENWPFLNKCIDLQSSPGLEMLETYLHNKLVEILSAQNEANDSSPGIAKPGTRETSDCLISPIEKLCVNFDTLSLSAHSNQGEPSSNLSTSSSVSNMSHLLIEKSCEVFSKRLLQGLKNAAFEHNRSSLVRILRQESKHLNNVVSSFTGDPRFQGVSLNRIHSRIARCLMSLLMNSCPPECVHWIVATFSEISNNKLLNRYSLDSDNTTSSDKSPDEAEDNASVLCLISQILRYFDPDNSDSTVAQSTGNSANLCSSSDIVIHGRGTGLMSVTHPEDQGSYVNNNLLSSDNSNSNKLGTSASENSNKIGGTVQENGSLSKPGEKSRTHIPPIVYANNEPPKILNDMLNSGPSQGPIDRTDDPLAKLVDPFIKPASSFTNGILKSFTKEDYLYVSSGSEKEAERNWNLSVPCACTARPVAPRNLFSNIRSYSRFHSYSYRAQYGWGKSGKRIDFDLEDLPMRGRSSRGAGLMNLSGESQAGEKSIAETNYNLTVSSSSSDSSDTEDEYYTPPGSYTSEQVFLSSSEEEMMDANEEDIEVFLVGSSLSGTDVDVLQTLSLCPKIDAAKYPNIYKWRHLVQLKLNQLYQETFQHASPTVKGNLNRMVSSPRILPNSRSLFSPARQFPGGTNASLVRPSGYKPLQASTPSGITDQS